MYKRQTSIEGAKIIHSANYYATLNEPGPVIAGSSSSAYSPTYTLSRSTSQANEGQSFSITLITTNVNAGTTVPFTITGVQSADIGGANLTGNFITGTTDTFTYPVTSDLSTEGAETLERAGSTNGKHLRRCAYGAKLSMPPALCILHRGGHRRRGRRHSTLVPG